MTLVMVGLASAVWAAQTRSPLIVVLASIVLGGAYGVTQFAGLAEVHRIADPRSLGMATATYQMLSYLGFALPFLLALAENHRHLGPPALLLVVLGLGALAPGWLIVVTGRSRRNARPAGE